MAKIIEVKVMAFDSNKSMIATLIDPNEIDDVVKYDLLIPAHFGSTRNPWPKVGEELLIRYDNKRERNLLRDPILEAWRPVPTFVPA